LAFLSRARVLGFTIGDCRTLMALWEDKDRADGKASARDHLSMIEAKIADLRAIHNTLSHLIDACADDSHPDCPILRTLAAPRVDILGPGAAK